MNMHTWDYLLYFGSWYTSSALTTAWIYTADTIHDKSINNRTTFLDRKCGYWEFHGSCTKTHGMSSLKTNWGSTVPFKCGLQFETHIWIIWPSFDPHGGAAVTHHTVKLKAIDGSGSLVNISPSRSICHLAGFERDPNIEGLSELHFSTQLSWRVWFLLVYGGWGHCVLYTIVL